MQIQTLNNSSWLEAHMSALEHAVCSQPREIVMSVDALGRVLASDVIASKNVPSFDNSALDGFAYNHDEGGDELEVVQTIYAGDVPKAMIQRGQCYRIMTGAMVPPDVDTVVAIEECANVTPTSVEIPADTHKGNAIRLQGEEIQKGEVLLEQGSVVDAAAVALLAAQGIAAVEVYRRLTIAVASTGDEIKEPWECATEDQIYNANSSAIISMLREHGFEAQYVGLMPDRLDSSVEFVSRLGYYDVIITTGGVSTGDADFVIDAFGANGLRQIVRGVHVKPGHPTTMGIMGSSYVMAMPGNPLASILNIWLLGIPVLRKLQGAREYHFRPYKLRNIKPFRFKPNRTNVVLGSIQEGGFVVTRDNKIGSGMLMPLYESDAVVLAGEGKSIAEAGEELIVIPMKSIYTTHYIDLLNKAKKQ